MMFAAVVVVLLGATCCQAAIYSAKGLRINYSALATAVDALQPIAFSWILDADERGVVQTSYIVNVYNVSQALLWTTGNATSTTPTAHYSGTSPLPADADLSFTVQWSDSLGRLSPVSPPYAFHTGLTGREWEAGGAQWIGCPVPAGGAGDVADGVYGMGYTQLRTEFDLSLSPGVTLLSSHAYIAGLGYYHAWLNGQHLGEAVITPRQTAYNMRVVYQAHDMAVGMAADGTAIPGDSRSPTTGTYFLPGTYPVVPPTAAGAGGTRHAFALLLGYGWSQLRNQYWMGQNDTVDGNGKWHQSGWQRRARVLLTLHLSNGTVLYLPSEAGTGAGTAMQHTPWQCGVGGLVNASIYDGSSWDSGRETAGWLWSGYVPSPAANWTGAVEVGDPGGVMDGDNVEPAAVVRLLPAVNITNLGASNPALSGQWTVDFGQSFSGGVLLTLPAPVPAGRRISAVHSETTLHPPYGPANGSVYTDYLRGALCTEHYVTSAALQAGQSYVGVPLFTWHGVRYAQFDFSDFGPGFTPQLAWFQGMHYRTSYASTGSLSFDPLGTSPAHVLDQLHEAIWWTIGSNSVGSPSDSVSRAERLGWTGDSMLAMPTTAMLFDSAAYYRAWAANIHDGMVNLADAGAGMNGPGGQAGCVPVVIPHIGPFGAQGCKDTSWDSVWPAVLTTLYSSYGDVDTAAAYWSDLQAWFTRLLAIAQVEGIDQLPSTFADWAPAIEKSAWEGNWTNITPHPITGAHALLRQLGNVAAMAEGLGQADYAGYLQKQLQTLQPLFHSAFYAGGGMYGNASGWGLQSANAFALQVGAVPPADMNATLQALVNDITSTYQGHFSTGVLGFAALFPALTTVGLGELALSTLLVPGAPGPAYSFNEAPYERATTLWELWHGDIAEAVMDSRNQQMWASVGAWLYSDVLGLSQLATAAPAWRSILVHPRVTHHPALTQASGSFTGPSGQISVTWQNVSSAQFTLTASLPSGTTALIRLPVPWALNGNAGAVQGTEAGVLFFSQGAFIPGAVQGVVSAALSSSAPGPTLDVQCAGSGRWLYAFSVA